MVRIHPGAFVLGRGAVVSLAVLGLGAGCSPPMYAEPAAPPTYVQGASVVSGPDDADLVYTQDPPVVNIETYPSVDYGGVPVYYVGGQWYRRGSHGWGYYRQEPAELGRQRESHARDERWERARAAPRSAPEQAAPQPRPGVEEPRGPERGAAPVRAEDTRPAPVRPGATESRVPDREATPAPVVPSKPKATNAPAEQDETQTPPAKKNRGRAPVKRAPGAPERR